MSAILLYPVATCLKHAILDVRALDIFDLFLQILFLLLESIPMVHLDVFTEGLGLLRAFDGVVLLFLFGLGLSLHAKENHLLLSHLFDCFASKNCTNATLHDLSRLLFLFLFGRSLHLTVVHTLAVLSGLKLTVNLLERVQVTSTTLSTSFVLLD